MLHAAASPLLQLIAPARMAMNFGELALHGITPDRFRRVPAGINTNSPAFIYGHLAIYPNTLFELWGLGPEAPTDPGEHAVLKVLFSAGKPALDDPEGRHYPSMAEIIPTWKKGYQALLDAAPSVPSEILAQPTPIERLRPMLPTIGELSGFLMIGHPMLHYGQVSVWRRIMGLGPCLQ